MSTWAKRIRDLQAAGMLQSEIGEACGLAVSTISDLANERSAEPRGEAAIKLHELHLKRCQKPSRSMSTG
jgi:transcriptional regulator with XRE-family HTH domain